MIKKIVNTCNAPTAIGPYSQAVKAGNLIFTSGQIGIDPGTGELCAADVKSQTLQALKNLENILAAEGAEMANVIKTTVFITDMAEFPAVNDVYKQFFTAEMPARSCVAVKQLPKGALVEIECTAAI